MGLAGVAVMMKWPGIVAMLCVCIYGSGFQLAWGSVPWLYPAEIFTMAEKEKAFSVPGTLFGFGALNVLNLFFVLKYIKETKGVALEEVPELFNSKRRARTH